VDREAILGRFDRLNVWSRGGQRAPHKPLLTLYALGRWARGDRGDVPFADVDRDLTALLKEFGPARQSYHPEYPFWRLKNDGVWQVRAQGELKPRQSNTDPPKSVLLTQEARGGFSDDVKAALQADPALFTQLAASLLEHHFPESLHPDILATTRAAIPQATHARAFRVRCARAAGGRKSPPGGPGSPAPRKFRPDAFGKTAISPVGRTGQFS